RQPLFGGRRMVPDLPRSPKPISKRRKSTVELPGSVSARMNAMKQQVSAAALMLVLAPVLLDAQWPNYPDKKIPRSADGKVNFDAPAPRTADGKIDFTGVFENLWFYNGRIGQPPRSGPGEPPQTTF